jgi:hypothetical protein
MAGPAAFGRIFCLMPRNPSCRSIALGLAAALLATSAAVIAQSTNADGTQTYVLTQQQKDQLMATGSETAVDASLLRAQNGGTNDGKIHGDVGMTVGTHNTHGVYGDAVVPLGGGATAAFSFENYQTAPVKGRWNHWYSPVTGSYDSGPPGQ